MADLHKAIRSIYNEVITINGDTQETIVAKDKDGNEVSINWNTKRFNRTLMNINK